MLEMTETLRILEPYPGIFAYYDGRVAGKRLHAQAANWLDDGAYSLGIASYALIDRDEALAHDPLLVKRLRRMRAQRQRSRSARRLGIDL